jgi:hypothetical protein
MFLHSVKGYAAGTGACLLPSIMASSWSLAIYLGIDYFKVHKDRLTMLAL